MLTQGVLRFPIKSPLSVVFKRETLSALFKLFRMHKIEMPGSRFLLKGKIIIMEPLAYKFVNWDVPKLGSLKDSKAYMLRERLNQGASLTREEKNWLTEKVNTNSFFRRSIPLMDIRF